MRIPTESSARAAGRVGLSWAAAFLSLVVLLSLGALAVPGTATAASNYAFELPDLEGQEVSLQELLERGPVLVNFWATWCKPCTLALPHLDALQRDFGEAGLTVVAISVDNARSISKVKPFIEGHGYTFTVLLDTNGQIRRRFKARATPYTILLDQDGDKVFAQIGYRRGDERKFRRHVLSIIDLEEVTEGAGDEGDALPGDASSAGTDAAGVESRSGPDASASPRSGESREAEDGGGLR